MTNSFIVSVIDNCPIPSMVMKPFKAEFERLFAHLYTLEQKATGNFVFSGQFKQLLVRLQEPMPVDKEKEKLQMMGMTVQFLLETLKQNDKMLGTPRHKQKPIRFQPVTLKDYLTIYESLSDPKTNVSTEFADEVKPILNFAANRFFKE